MPKMDLRPNEVEQRLREIEKWIGDCLYRNDDVGGNEDAFKAATYGEQLLALLREREEENRRLRQIIADVRRLVQKIEPDNPEVRGA